MCRVSNLGTHKKNSGRLFKMQTVKHLSPEFHPISVGWVPDGAPEFIPLHVPNAGNLQTKVKKQ